MSLVGHFRVTRSQAAADPTLGLKKDLTPNVSKKRKQLDIDTKVPTISISKSTPLRASDVSKAMSNHSHTNNTPSKVKKAKKTPGQNTMKTPLQRKKFGFSTSGSLTPLGKVVLTTPERVAKEQRMFTEHDVSRVYKIIRKHTGTLGGNAAGGAIYGEITQKSFQRVVDYLKAECEFTSESTFMDIGSGLGKPNFHTAVDPGVKLSFGLELEMLRWQLSIHNLKHVISGHPKFSSGEHRVMFLAGDITDAQTFDPFTHVYSFDVGFPPQVMDHMASSFNASHRQTKYFISFHHPRRILDEYGFEVELLTKIATSMSGSSEGHTCYVYQRKNSETTLKKKDTTANPDPLFQSGIELLEGGVDRVKTWMAELEGENENSSQVQRRQRQVRARKQPLREVSQMSLQPFVRTIAKLNK